MAVIIAEQLPDRRVSGIALALAPAPALELPPVDVIPDCVRPAMERYAADTGQASRVALVVAVDRVGHGWEHTIASRALEARAELVGACRRVEELHDELVSLQATAQWLRSFPRSPSWEPEPYSLHVAGRLVAVTEILGAIEDTCDVDERLITTARRRVRADPPYEPLAPRRGRPGAAPALNALNEAGSTLASVAELADASESAVSRWLKGDRPYPERLPVVLDQLAGAAESARILALIPASR